MCVEQITNSEYLRSIQDESLAAVCEDGCPPGITVCPEYDDQRGLRSSCIRCWIGWLKTPYSEETDKAVRKLAARYKTPDFTNHTGQGDYTN